MSETSANSITLQRFAPQPEHMHCMEVWGGNTAVDKWFDMPGLTAWVYSQPTGRLSAEAMSTTFPVARGVSHGFFWPT